MIELVALDIAGTTVQEYNSVYVALEDAVRAAGADPSTDDIAAWMGADKSEAIRGLTGLEEVEHIHDDFRRRLAGLYEAQPPVPLPGVPETLGRLRASGVKVALTTGFDREITDDLLGRLGWAVGENLDAVITVDQVAAGRPAPYLIFRAMEQTGVRSVRALLTAGDTTRDLEAGTNAGAAVVVGVLSGGQSRGLLETAPHTHILGSVADLPDLLASLGQPV